MLTQPMLTLDNVYHAAFVLREIARKTDLIPAPQIGENCSVYLKTENLQVTGSFKVRGAYYKISQLTPAEKEKGVIACSAGNHAQGVALAAAKNHISSLICIPATAPISKVEATKRYGAEVCLVQGIYDDAHDKAVELQKETGRTLIHPFDDPDVIAGQGTIGLEILDQMPDADVVLVPVGGGGLASGVAFTIKSLRPSCKVYGVQAAGAASMEHALQTRKPEGVEEVHTFADGIAVKCPGDLTYKLCNKYLDGVITVSEDEIAAAILTLIEQQKLITEGAGAVSVAAVLANKLDLKGKKVVCLLSGGNIDVTILSKVISRGLLKSGRSAELTFKLLDRPGELSTISSTIAKLGGNVVGVYHDRSDLETDVSGCFLRIRMETRNAEHIEQIRRALEAEGYPSI